MLPTSVWLRSIAAGAAAVFLLAGCSGGGQEQSRPTVPNVPSTASPGPLIGGVGVATIRAVPQVPGGCSSTYLIEGEIEHLPEARQHLWILTRLEADPANGAPDVQHYPKVKLKFVQGTYALTVPNSTPTGTRRAIYLLIAANDNANADLELSYEADVKRDRNVYPDGRRVALPPGSDAIAQTDVLVQTCA